jgi:hypothetical protein
MLFQQRMQFHLPKVDVSLHIIPIHLALLSYTRVLSNLVHAGNSYCRGQRLRKFIVISWGDTLFPSSRRNTHLACTARRVIYESCQCRWKCAVGSKLDCALKTPESGASCSFRGLDWWARRSSAMSTLTSSTGRSSFLRGRERPSPWFLPLLLWPEEHGELERPEGQGRLDPQL